MPATARTATGMSARSPSTNSTPGRCWRLRRWPVIRLSEPRTVCPRCNSSCARCDPMKPAPPVTRYEAIESARESRARQARCHLQRILVVELFQHLIGQPDAVQLPERMVVAIVVEILVVGLEHTPVVRVFIRLVAVLAEQNPVLIFDEELVRGPRLAAEVVQHRGHVVVDVRVGI